jgi:hypothetical protein
MWGQSLHVFRPYVNETLKFREVGGLAVGVANDNEVKFMSGGDIVGFAAHPGVIDRVELRVRPGVDIADPGVMNKFVIWREVGVRNQHHGAGGDLMFFRIVSTREGPPES